MVQMMRSQIPRSGLTGAGLDDDELPHLNRHAGAACLRRIGLVSADRQFPLLVWGASAVALELGVPSWSSA
jgi:hypothetical protein